MVGAQKTRRPIENVDSTACAQRFQSGTETTGTCVSAWFSADSTTEGGRSVGTVACLAKGHLGGLELAVILASRPECPTSWFDKI